MVPTMKNKAEIDNTAKEETQRLLNAVQHERDRLLALVNSIADEVWFADTEKKFTLANPSALREFGFGFTDEIDVEKLAESLKVYRPDGSPRPIEEAPPLRALQGEVVRNQEEIIRTPASGELRYRQVSAFPVRDATGKIIGSVSVVHDITEAKRMEEELRRSRDELEMRVQERTAELQSASLYARSLIETSLDPLVTISLDGKVMDVNRATELVTGVARDQLIGSDFSDYFTDPERAREGYKHVFSKSSVKDYPLAIHHVSGYVTHVLYNATVYRNEAGEVEGVFAAARDITQRKRAEEALERHAQMLDFANDSIMVFDLTGRITYWNKGAEALYGWTKREAIDQSIHVLLQTRFPAPFEDLKRTLFSEGHWTGELIHTKRDGTEVIVASRWTLQKSPDGEPSAILEINNDVTERKRVEKELRDASLYSRSLIEASIDPLVTIRRDGKIMDVNRATELATGLSRGTLIGSDFSDYFTEPEKAREGYKQVFSKGFVRDYPLAIRHTSGRGIEVLYNATVYKNEAGDVQGVFAAARDITERKRTEETLRESEKRLRLLSSQLLVAQEKERKLAAQEIHDSLGASLAGIKFKVENTLNEIGDGHPQTRVALKSLIPIIQGAIEEGRRIQMALRPSMLDDLGILATINWFCRQFESTYSRIHIRQEINIEESEVPDSLKTVIFRVLQEATNNIAKHSKADRVNVLFRKVAGAIELGIQDYGQGFDPGKASSRVGTTRGLGLDSMRERTELSGGSFSIESSKGTGTVIRATWPIEQLSP